MEDTLLKMKAEIEEDKNRKLRLEGELDSVMGQLNHDFGFKTIEDAEKALKSLEQEVPTLESNLNKEIENLKSAYSWKTI